MQAEWLRTGMASVAVFSLLASCTGDPQTATPENTHTPMPSLASPSPSVALETPTVRAVILHLKRAGIRLPVVKVFNARNDPNELLGRPGQYVEKANFWDKRITPEPGLDPNDKDGPEIDLGGSIEIFKNARAGKSRHKYISGLAKSSTLFAEWDFLLGDGLLLLRLSQSLIPRQAREYKRALVAVFGP